MVQAPAPARLSQLLSAVCSTKAASPPPACQPKVPLGPKANTRGVFRLRKRRTLAWLASGRPKMAGASRMGAAGACAWLTGAAASPISAASVATKPFQPGIGYSFGPLTYLPRTKLPLQAPLALTARGGHIAPPYCSFQGKDHARQRCEEGRARLFWRAGYQRHPEMAANHLSMRSHHLHRRSWPG